MDENDIALCEKLGIEGVRLEMAKGDGRMGRPSSPVREEIEHWLKAKEAERALASSSKRDAREAETLAIAKEANRIASRAERWAMYAAIAAVIALSISIANKTS